MGSPRRFGDPHGQRGIKPNIINASAGSAAGQGAWEEGIRTAWRGQGVGTLWCGTQAQGVRTPSCEAAGQGIGTLCCSGVGGVPKIQSV